MQAAQRISALEDELRRSKRREEKLAALQYRLREDLKQNGGSTGYSPFHTCHTGWEESRKVLQYRMMEAQCTATRLAHCLIAILLQSLMLPF